MRCLNSKIIFIAILLLVNHKKTIASDSLYVLFLKKEIVFDDKIISFKFQRKTYLFKQINDTLTECYILMKSKMLAHGLLKTKLYNNKVVGLRDGDWLIYDKKQGYLHIYFLNDKILFDEQFKSTPKITVFPPSSVEEL